MLQVFMILLVTSDGYKVAAVALAIKSTLQQKQRDRNKGERVLPQSTKQSFPGNHMTQFCLCPIGQHFHPWPVLPGQWDKRKGG